MARTPKSVRRHQRASEALDRATEASYAHLTEDDHPAHRKQVQAFNRHDRALAHTNREHARKTGREVREARKTDPPRWAF